MKIGKSKDQNPTKLRFFYEIRKRIMEKNLVVKTSLGPEKDDELGWGRRIRVG